MVVIIVMKLTPEQEFSVSPMNLDIIYEDEYILVINKEAGVLMHPTSTVRDHTLATLNSCSGVNFITR